MKTIERLWTEQSWQFEAAVERLNTWYHPWQQQLYAPDLWRRRAEKCAEIVHARRRRDADAMERIFWEIISLCNGIADRCIELTTRDHAKIERQLKKLKKSCGVKK